MGNESLDGETDQVYGNLTRDLMPMTLPRRLFEAIRRQTLQRLRKPLVTEKSCTRYPSLRCPGPGFA